MKRFAVICLLFIILSSGCASFRNNWAANGSLFTTTRGDYIVISQSGGLIMDVWKLTDVFVESEGDSDGWRFINEGGNVKFIGGDVNVTRVNEKGLMDKYHEYHMEFETQSYRDKFDKRRPVCGRYQLRGRTKRFFGRVA